MGLLVSEQTPLFGFMEFGYRPAIAIAIACEAAAVLLLGADLARSARRRIPQHPPDDLLDRQSVPTGHWPPFVEP